MSELLDRVQCSQSELLEGLQTVNAIRLNATNWCLIDSDMRMRIVSLIGNVISEHSWSWGNVPKSEAVQAISDIEAKEIIEQVFDHYFDPQGRVNREKLCRFYGEYLLQSSTVFNCKEFLQIWQESLPIIDDPEDPGFTANLDQLDGIALCNEEQIRFFPEWKLPVTIQDRLTVLFDSKEKWSLSEITPFVINMTTPKLNVKALLTKYARASRVNGEQVFSSKHHN